ncbi:DUF1707 SHOCT-like domain-containing protein [Pseudonocardia acaciae]|uniref:DUF1707 SHOCT-like domain-containing protein n=1 Tax=Pseudonocardia acaciae TaxID=551276 RepID=UPI00055D27D8|nr:DUF1707 domain-containing protein [Pseudonocardia acaciae]
MAGNELRVADADRERVAERLRRAHGEGRITLVEFDERVAAAYAARTDGDLATLTADLPPEPVPARPVAAGDETRAPARVRGGRRLAWRIEAGAWLFASVVNLVIWGIVSMATGAAVYPWWAWVAGPWGAVLALRLVTGRSLCRPA